MSSHASRHIRSKTKIDVLIPAIEKDLSTLPYVIDGVRKHVKHPIGKIMVVSPPSSKIMALCRRKNCTFVNERRVLPITKQQIHYRTAKADRSGWLLQQLLKLAGSRLTTQRFYLVIDADTVLIRPHVFLVNGKTVFYCRNWSHSQYFHTYKRLLGKRPTSTRSFVTHYMLFDKSRLSQLKRAIASRHNRSWYSAIIKCTNKNSYVGFSEFETYGNFIHSAYRHELILRGAYNKSLPTSPAKLSSKRLKKLAKHYLSLSFHKRKWYIRHKRA